MGFVGWFKNWLSDLLSIRDMKELRELKARRAEMDARHAELMAQLARVKTAVETGTVRDILHELESLEPFATRYDEVCREWSGGAGKS